MQFHSVLHEAYAGKTGGDGRFLTKSESVLQC